MAQSMLLHGGGHHGLGGGFGAGPGGPGGPNMGQLHLAAALAAQQVQHFW